MYHLGCRSIVYDLFVVEMVKAWLYQQARKIN